jgi:hypothetical protein
MKENDEIEDLFASSFGNFEETPPQAVKSNLDAQLYPKNTIVSKKRGNLKWLLILIPIIGLSAIVWYNSSATTSSTIAKNNNSTPSSTAFNNSKENSKKTNKTANLKVIKVNEFNNSDTLIKTTQIAENKIFNSDNKKSKKSIDSNKASSKGFNSTNTSNGTKLSKSEQSKETKKSELDSGISTQNHKKQTKTKRNSTYKNLNSLTTTANNENQNSSRSETKIQEEVALNAINSTVSNDNSLTPNNSLLHESKEETSSSKNASILPKDSLDNLAENSSKEMDSSQTTMVENNKVKDEVKSSSKFIFKSLWSISLYGGIAKGLSVLNPASTLLSEQFGSYFSLETSYKFNSKIGLLTGFSYDAHKETYKKEFLTIDSVVSNYTVTYITDSTNTIIDSVVTYFYENDTTLNNENQIISYTTFSIPLYFNYTFFSKNNWSGDISAGIRLNYFKTTVNSSSVAFTSPTLSNFGLQFQLRPQINYDWTKLSLGIYGLFGFDAKQAATWSDFTRNRFTYGTGLVVSYRFLKE